MAAKTVIITGASRGLGLAAARFAVQFRANVVLNARSEGLLRDIEREIEKTGAKSVVVTGDVSQPEVCETIAAKAVEQFGRIDALVNNAAILDPLAPLSAVDPAAWARIWAVNVIGPAQLVQASLPSLRANQGRIVNVSSSASLQAYQGWAAYSATKAALNQYNSVLALEERDITAVALDPGVIDTAMQAKIRQEGSSSMDPAVYSRSIQRYREGKLLHPEQPGRALAILALYAPHGWSGKFVVWNSPEVQRLVQEYAKLT